MNDRTHPQIPSNVTTIWSGERNHCRVIIFQHEHLPHMFFWQLTDSLAELCNCIEFALPIRIPPEQIMSIILADVDRLYTHAMLVAKDNYTQDGNYLQ